MHTVDAEHLSCQGLQSVDPDLLTFHGDRVLGYAEELARRTEDHVFGCERIGHIPAGEPAQTFGVHPDHMTGAGILTTIAANPDPLPRHVGDRPESARA